MKTTLLVFLGSMVAEIWLDLTELYYHVIPCVGIAAMYGLAAFLSVGNASTAAAEKESSQRKRDVGIFLFFVATIACLMFFGYMMDSDNGYRPEEFFSSFGLTLLLITGAIYVVVRKKNSSPAPKNEHKEN